MTGKTRKRSRKAALLQTQTLKESESAMAITLPSGTYTAVVWGKNGGTGVAVTEIYLTSEQADSTVSNISSRACVGTGENVMIGSVIVDGSRKLDLVMRRSDHPWNGLASPLRWEFRRSLSMTAMAPC